MTEEPWKEWVPGVLSKKQMILLCEKNIIENVTNPQAATDNSSIDLTLSREGYAMKDGSVKPFGEARYLTSIIEKGLCEPLNPTDGEFILKARKTYVFKTRERLGRLPSQFHGQATAKSTIGRIDVLARLIVDGMDCYEGFNYHQHNAISNGLMYIEITPMTFDVVVKEGVSLTQLRLFQDEPKFCELHGDVLFKSVLHNTESIDGSLSVDLSEDEICKASAFCASSKPGGNSREPIRVWLRDQIDPKSYWEPEIMDKNNRLIIQENKFYILKSKEKLSIPRQIAVYCRATDETIGEMRIHYAGFVHPCFGQNRIDGDVGTPLIFEVRGHDVNVSLKDGEKMARLIFYRMSEDCEPNKIPDRSEPSKSPGYNDQTLRLSGIFKKWS